MDRCLRQNSSDTDELTYQSGFTKINYPFNGASSDSLRQSYDGSKDVSSPVIEKVQKNIPSQPKPKVLDSNTIADRCRIGIGRSGNSVFIEGHGSGSNYRPKGKK